MSNIEKINVGGIEYNLVDALTVQMVCDNVESGTTASKSYTIGNYMIFNNTLYRIIANISEGQEIIIGTNIVLANISNEIRTLILERELNPTNNPTENANVSPFTHYMVQSVPEVVGYVVVNALVRSTSAQRVLINFNTSKTEVYCYCTSTNQFIIEFYYKRLN